MDYSVRAPRPPLAAGWDDPAWVDRPLLDIARFRPESSDHRPRTRARLAYDEKGIGGVFHVQDRYVRSVHTHFGEPVYRDSCVEIFLQPKPDKGYLNFEMNAGGTLLASHITDHRRTPDAHLDQHAGDYRKFRCGRGAQPTPQPSRIDRLPALCSDFKGSSG